jgi:hypothetical protein
LFYWKVDIQYILESFQADNLFDHFPLEVKATVRRVKCRLATLVALLIELKAQIL